VTAFAYNSNDQVTTITDPRGTVYLTNQYDSSGRVTQQTQADGNTFPGQDARLSFSGTAGQLVNLAVSNSTFTTAGRCLNYSILNPDGSQLTTAFTCGAGGALNQVSLPSTGTYTALISPMNGATGSATVTLTSN